MNAYTETGSGKMPCEEIRRVLFDYMSRELGPNRSVLVREHLRRCPACQAEAARMQEILAMLKRVSVADADRTPRRLSEQRRARLLRAWLHPVLDRIYSHHVIVSTIVAALILAGLAWALARWRLQHEEESAGPPVVIGEPPLPDADPADGKAR